MSALYGTVIGAARTNANRRGHRVITAAVRSWDGSVTVIMLKGGKDDPPTVVIRVGEGSRVGGREVWRGSLASLMLQGLLKAQLGPRNAEECHLGSPDDPPCNP